MGIEALLDFLPTLGTVVGSLLGVVASNKVWQYRLAQLEQKVEKHNNLVERTYKLEGRMDAADREIEDLKAYHKPV